jgi:hypothetical protein
VRWLSRATALRLGLILRAQVGWVPAIVSTEDGLRVRSRRGWNMTPVLPELRRLQAGVLRLEGDRELTIRRAPDFFGAHLRRARSSGTPLPSSQPPVDASYSQAGSSTRGEQFWVEPCYEGLAFRLAKRRSGRRIVPMGNLIAKIRKWLGLGKKSDTPTHGTDAP